MGIRSELQNGIIQCRGTKITETIFMFVEKNRNMSMEKKQLKTSVLFIYL